MEYQIEGFRVSNKVSEFDIDVIHEFISNSYWAKSMPKALLVSAIENSLCFGVFSNDNKQVAFARVITDKATFAYLADVFVVEAHRGRGLSKYMIDHILMQPELQGLRRIMLATADAHTLYEQFGFKPIQQPEMFMEVASSSIRP